MIFSYISKILGGGEQEDLFGGWKRVSGLALPYIRACTVDIYTMAEF